MEIQYLQLDFLIVNLANRDWRYPIRLSPIEKRITRFKLELIFNNANYGMIRLKYNLGNESFVHNIITRQQGTARFVSKLNRQFPAQTA